MPRPSSVRSSNSQKDTSTAARRAAFTILNDIDRTDRTLDQVIHEHTDLLKALSGSDRALFNTLVDGVLRWRRRLDFVIDRFSRTRLDKIDPDILNILRLGLHQILNLDRIPDSTAVNTAVELSKSVSPNWVVRFVNGVLRNAARKHQSVSFPEHSDDPVAALGVNKSFPDWMIRSWLDRFGLDETSRLCDASNDLAPLTLRANTLMADRDRLLDLLVPCAQIVQSTQSAPDGITLRQPDRSVMDLPGFQRGWFQVQDEAAQLVSCLLDAKPGEKVLDACAGLGGKTGHIAQMMKNRGQIVAMDNNAARLLMMAVQMQRLGVTIVDSICCDIDRMALGAQPGKFDHIMVDAPCSGIGVIRRNPDAKWRLQQSTLTDNRIRQSRFLDRMAALVRPTGTLVYAVCSFEPEENEKVVEKFLSEHGQAFKIDTPPAEPFDRCPDLIDENGFFRSMPHHHDMDGFFAVCFRRQP